ncbi:hypothetical protein SAMN02910317_00222 [Ruminococcaceae bacterium FB2012]|nr:hypothetical protein SAMN02910317_00222 [Ruminococcaceae bacterium FB2012]
MADKKEAVKETVEKAAEAVKAEGKKVAGAAKKAAAKTETAAKKAAAKTETAAKKTATAAKKTVKKAAEKVEAKTGDKIVLEFADRQIEMKAVLEACKADYKAQTKKTAKNVQVYVKPEDNAAYYVVGKFTGKVDL